MTCDNKCTHYSICEDRKNESANIEDCPYYDAWKTEIIEIRKYYAKCPYCEFSFEMQNHRELPYFCGGCGRRLRGEEA